MVISMQWSHGIGEILAKTHLGIQKNGGLMIKGMVSPIQCVATRPSGLFRDA